ncbi:MAG: amine oxidase, partial [Candidatus Eremiobacteraeota bacterium]|nr:amine oxidase [Candidatus Eremiobacteraeota bacterium]
KVTSRATDMSFGYHCRLCGLQYGGHDLRTLFAQPTNLMHPDFLRLVVDMARFNRRSRAALANGGVADSLAGLVKRWRLSSYFLRHYLVPLGASLWSAPAERMLEFPAQTYLKFFANHGLLSVTDRPPWETVEGGSHRYLEAFRRGFKGEIVLEGQVEQVDGGRLRVGGQWRDFDHVVLACHADQALRLLAEPTPLQVELLSPWRYSQNSVVLHTDRSVMPPLARVWSSWNYVRDRNSSQQVTVSYWMNRLQGLKTQQDYFVTLNSRQPLREEAVVANFEYWHPQFDLAAAATQARLPELNKHPQLSFCGSYFGYGFHEDAFASGVAVAEKFGCRL